MQSRKLSSGLTAVLATFAMAMLTTGTRAAAQTEKILYTFVNNGTDGSQPQGTLLIDAAGNLYGTTTYGGTGTCLLDGSVPGCGIVFELKPQTGGAWEEKILHTFLRNDKDGQEPWSGMIFDAAGNLYGTTSSGGPTAALCPGGDAGTDGCGTVFELLKPKTGNHWAELVIHSFNSNGKGTDGAVPPYGNLIFDTSGNLYGTTLGGGANNFGMVFELMPTSPGSWYEKYLHAFSNNGKDGLEPRGGLVFDTAGNLYGTTYGGGAYGYGTVFELIPNLETGGWTEKILHSFEKNGTDGIWPSSTLVIDSSGNLYGTAAGGGAYGYGTVFEFMLQSGVWAEKILHNFDENGTDGAEPIAGLTLHAGCLYGTTYLGGTPPCGNGGCGVVFELTPEAGGHWTETILHSFNNLGTDGVYPTAGVIFDTSGILYGTTQSGGTYGNGVVFEITP